MPTYNYECCDCLKNLEKRLDRNHTIEEYEEFVLFETSHRMKATPQELLLACVCPRCNSTNCVRSFHGSNIVGYIRGYGMLDKVGAHRDMNLFKLSEDDPYKCMRVDGEVDDLKHRIKKAGKHQSKRIHSIPAKADTAITDAVTKAVFTK